MNFLNLIKSIIMIELLVPVAVTGRHHLCIVVLMTSPIRMELNLCQKLHQYVKCQDGIESVYTRDGKVIYRSRDRFRTMDVNFVAFGLVTSSSVELELRNDVDSQDDCNNRSSYDKLLPI